MVLGTMISALIGGPPKTTYGENIGVLAITKVYSVYVIAGAALFAIIFGFVGKITALINTIPNLLWVVFQFYYLELLLLLV